MAITNKNVKKKIYFYVAVLNVDGGLIPISFCTKAILLYVYLMMWIKKYFWEENYRVNSFFFFVSILIKILSCLKKRYYFIN